MTFNKCKCLNCGFEFKFESASEDDLGWHTTCPECSGSFDINLDDYLPAISEVSVTKKEEIRVKVNGGYLVAGRNPDPTYDGIHISFETDEGDIIDVVSATCYRAWDKKIHVYCYEDVYNEDFTSKYVLDSEEIREVFNDDD